MTEIVVASQAELDAQRNITYLLRSSTADRRSWGGFQYPESGPVECPDWTPTPECGGGLHGLVMGIGDASLLNHDTDAVWQVLAVDASLVVDIDGKKVKAPRADVVYSGDRNGAIALLVERGGDASKMVFTPASTSGDWAPASTSGDWAPASTSGDYAPASTSGYYAPASTSGDYAPASTSGDWAPASTSGDWAPASTSGYKAPASTSGDYAPASTSGYYAPASTSGDYAPASTSGNRAPASTSGDYAPASTSGYKAPASTSGKHGIASSRYRAKAGDLGAVVLTYWSPADERYRVVVGYVGEHGIVADTWYGVDDSGRIAVCDDC